MVTQTVVIRGRVGGNWCVQHGCIQVQLVVQGGIELITEIESSKVEKIIVPLMLLLLMMLLLLLMMMELGCCELLATFTIIKCM